MLTAVIDGALLQCTQGSNPCPLTVTNHKGVLIDEKPAATIMDHAPGVNLKTFGTCKVTGGPCTPATPAPWLPGSGKQVQVGDRLVLLESDTLACSVPGVITIINPMQAKNVFDT